jgi:heterodisulfide reductase subunit A-like polyferredoxin
VRGSLVREKEYPPERDVTGEAPRVGVFVCHCGSNIGGYLDVPGVAEYARTLPGVVHAEANLYTCSQDTITHITETIAALRLNRMVVASCTPRTHEPLFQDSLRAAGLNPFLFEMANIRNQCSWVHSHDWDGATRKARELVRMSVARVLRQEPLHKIDLPLEKTALVIGGGVAGLTAARSLAEQGFPVHLVERSAELGGNLRQVYYTVESSRLKVESYQGNQPFGLSLRACPERSEGAKPSTLRAEPQGEAFNLQPETSDPQAFLAELIDAVEHQLLITVHLETDLVDTKGFVGNFTSLLRKRRTGVSSDRLKVEGSNLQPSTLRAEPQGEAFNLQPSTHELLTVQHGATIVATGGQEWHGDAYLLGQDARVMTQGDFEAWLAAQREPGSKGAEEQRSRGAEERKRMHFCTSAPRHLGSSGARLPIVARSVVMIQCVGPAERYCGRICCTTALKNALKIKELSPTTQVTVLYKDIRTYGFKERLYTEARRAGVVFIRYDDEHRPEVRVEGTSDDGQLALSGAKRRTTDSRLSTLSVKVWEPILGQELTLQPDLLILSTPIVPSAGAHEVGRILKVPVDLDGWFLEAHPKLRPVDFASDGVFMAGLAHYPKLLGESIAQAQAAAARAATILSKPVLSVGGVVAQIDQDQCTGCLTCVRACPYQVPQINPAAVGVGGILGAAEIQPAQCQGCGVCVAECPAKAIQLMHYTDAQVCAKIDAVFVSAGFVPLAAIG